jgi:hypothetical protein
VALVSSLICPKVPASDRGILRGHVGPDIEWDFARSPFNALFNQEVYRGKDGLRALIRGRREDAWEEIDDDLEELIETACWVMDVPRRRDRPS